MPSGMDSAGPRSYGPRSADSGLDRAAVRKDSTRALALLGLLVVSALTFEAFAVPRLTNFAFGDLEFSGWSGPVGSRIARGEIPYVDFVLPIPPGSLGLLALIEKLTGRALLIHELGLISVTQLGMALLGYAMVRPFVRRQTAVLVACSSLVILLRSPKECAYDFTAELAAWASIAVGAWALSAGPGRHRQRLWLATGFFAGLTLLFKQSTAIGSVGGWAVALGYVALGEALSDRRAVLLELGRDVLAWAIGVAAGFAALLVVLTALGTTTSAFFRAVFADGASLKGGSLSLGANLVSYLLGAPAYPASLLLTLLAAFVLVRLAARNGGFRLVGGPACESTHATAESRRWLLVGAATLVAFGSATLLLAARVSALPPSLAFWADRLRYVPGFGLLVGCFAFVAALVRIDGDPAERARARNGHALNAVFLAALGVSLLHNLSSPEFRPFYDPNPIIPIAFAFLYLGLERARLPRLELAVFALSLAALFSPKLERALAAQIPIGKAGHWGGLYVSESARPLVDAALRVRELTGPNDAVLTLPEDVQLAALMGRPRPNVQGAVLFVDQYPARLVDGDLARLEQNLPKVVVIRPAEREHWIRLFALWSNQSGARRVTERFLDDFLPRSYQLDSRYPTRFGDMSLTLEIWVRR